MESSDEQTLNWELIEQVFKLAKGRRLLQPHSLLAPKPYHFPQGTKHTGVATTAVLPASDPQTEILYNYGMPQVNFYIAATISAAIYGNEFADYTLEYFGVMTEQHITGINEHIIGQGRCLNTSPESLPLNAGMVAILENEQGFSISILVWRWRVFMNESPLCLENIYHKAIGWLPYLLGIQYSDPEKMVSDSIRFAPAFRLCNLVKANLSQTRNGYRVSQLEEWASQAIEQMAQASKQAGKIIPYSFTNFREAFPLSTTRQNLYNLIDEQTREGLRKRYEDRCNELLEITS